MHRAICMTWDEHMYSTSCAGCIFGGKLLVSLLIKLHGRLYSVYDVCRCIYVQSMF